MQCDWFMYHLRSNYKNRLEFPFKLIFLSMGKDLQAFSFIYGYGDWSIHSPHPEQRIISRFKPSLLDMPLVIFFLMDIHDFCFNNTMSIFVWFVNSLLSFLYNAMFC